MPAVRTRDTPVRPLEVVVAEPAPALNIISPTPRAFTFPSNQYTPSPSPSNSPFEPDLRPLTFTPPIKTHTPSSSISSLSSFLSPDAPAPAAPAAPTHRRRRSTASDVNERRPKKGDEDYVKRPENAFILFRRKCCEDRNLALGAGAGDVGENPSPVKKQRQADLSKTISQQWKSLNDDERKYWEDLAKEKKAEHERMHPHYVYRPQRVKGKRAAGKGKGKGAAEDLEDDGEGLSFVMPVPAVPQRPGRRAVSAPTPPPAFSQTIHIPTLYMPSTPTSPSMIPMIPPRRTMTPCELEPSLHYNFAPVSDFAQGWNPDAQGAFQSMYEMQSGSGFAEKAAGASLNPLSIPGSQGMYKSLVSPTADSSGPPSPHAGPFTPVTGGATLETMQIPAEAWTQHSGFTMLPPPAPEPRQLEYQPYAWQPNMWMNGQEPMFNEDFDLNLIPPIALDVPKFDVSTPTPGSAPAEDFAGSGAGAGEERDRDVLMDLFGYNAMTMVDGY